MNADDLTLPLPHRLRDGLGRLALVLRSEEWSAAAALGLTPTQLHILMLLAGRGGTGLKVKDIARHLGVSQPTATDSVAALERKKLLSKRADRADARAAAVAISETGRAMVKAATLVPCPTEQAIAALNSREQADLLLLVIKLIRTLQISGAIEVQRLCVTCRHFRPNVYPGAEQPHHCALVNAAFGTGDLRLDCREHEPAESVLQAATWEAFDTARQSPSEQPRD